MISEEYIKLFDKGAQFARAKKYHEALEAYGKILEPSPEDGPAKVVTGDFLGQVHMRKCWVLMDLGRYDEAVVIFSSEVMQDCLGQFDTEILYEYLYSYANCLGNLGRIEEMDEKFSVALKIAAEELGDEGRCEMCWFGLLSYASKHKANEYLARESERCLPFCENTGLKELWVVALTHAVEANVALGKAGRAKELVAIISDQAGKEKDDRMKDRARELEALCQGANS